MNFIVSFLIILLVSLPHSDFAMRKLEGNLSLSLSLSLSYCVSLYFSLVTNCVSSLDAELNKVRESVSINGLSFLFSFFFLFIF